MSRRYGWDGQQAQPEPDTLEWRVGARVRLRLTPLEGVLVAGPYQDSVCGTYWRVKYDDRTLIGGPESGMDQVQSGLELI